jgi:TolB-like protein
MIANHFAISLIVTILAWLLSGCAAPPPKRGAEYRQPAPEAATLPTAPATLAVMDLAVSSGLSPEQAAMLTDKLTGELGKSQSFAVTERARRDQVLASRGFKQSASCDQTACLAEAGQALGVRKVVGGSLGKFGKGYAVDLRLVDVWTGAAEKTFTKVYEGDVLVLLGAMQEAAAAFTGPKPSVPTTAPPAESPFIRRKK